MKRAIWMHFHTRRNLVQSGFTLVELLVAMVLMAIIMAMLIGAMRTMGQTELRVDQRLSRLDEIRVARNFIQKTLGRISPKIGDEPGAPGKKRIVFQVTSNSLTWLGIMPARIGAGGRTFFRLSLEDTAEGSALVLRLIPWQPNLLFPDWSKAESRVLIKDLTQLTFWAQGQAPLSRNAGNTWPTGWQNGWPVADAIPDQLRIKWSDGQGEIPEMTVSLFSLPQGDSSSSRVVVGGGR